MKKCIYLSLMSVSLLLGTYTIFSDFQDQDMIGIGDTDSNEGNINDDFIQRVASPQPIITNETHEAEEDNGVHPVQDNGMAIVDLRDVGDFINSNNGNDSNSSAILPAIAEEDESKENECDEEPER